MAGLSVLKFIDRQCWPGGAYQEVESEGKLQTCWGGFVSLCRLAWTTPPYRVDSRYAEAIVHVAVEFEDSEVVVPRYSEQLFPVSWLPLVFLVLNNKLC